MNEHTSGTEAGLTRNVGADPDWLDEATKTIGQYWRRKNARRKGLTTEAQPDATVVVR